MKKTFITGAAICFCLAADADNWEVGSRTDPMTDAVSCFAYTIGSKVYVIDNTLAYDPQIVFRVTAAAKSDAPAKIELYFAIEHEGLRRGDSTAAVRFDSDPAEDVAIRASVDRRAGFFSDPLPLVRRLMKAQKMLLRYQTTLGAIRTVSFNVSGLDAATKQFTSLAAVQAKLHPGAEPKPKTAGADNPPPEPSKPKPQAQKSKQRNATCRKCRGVGSLDVWRPCTSCNGSTRGCDKCRNSGWIGRVKAVEECPQCKGYGSMPPVR